MTRPKSAACRIAGIVLCAAFVPAVALAAGSAPSAWGDDTDCSACHQKEAVSFERIAAQSAPDAAADKPAEAGGASVAKDDVSAAETAGDVEKGVSASGIAEETGDEELVSAAGQTLARVHVALGCPACHSDAETLTKAHEGVTAESTLPKRLKKAKIDEGLCLSCHGNHESLAQATAGSTVLTDTEGTVVNPHDLPDVADHAKITCLSCHKIHGDAPVQKTAAVTCVACHHEGVYACGTCHSHE